MQRIGKRSHRIPALRLTTQPETLNCVMKYIFNWPVKGAELLYTCLLNLWQTLITYCSLADVFSPLRCNPTEKNTRQNLILCRRRPNKLFKQRWVGPIWTLLLLCVFTLKSNVIGIKSINYVCVFVGVSASEDSAKSRSGSDIVRLCSEDKKDVKLQLAPYRTTAQGL